MKKRLLALLACLCLAVGLLAACGGGNSGSAQDAAADAAADVTDAAADAADDAADAAADAADDAADAAADAAGANNGETYTLTLTSHDPETSATGQFLNDFAAKVAEESNGAIQIDVYHGGTIAGPKDSIDAVSNGTVDIAWGLQSFYDGMFPATEVFMLPLLDAQSAPQASEAIWEFYNTTDYMADEYANWHVLLLHCNCQTPLSISGKSNMQPETIADLAGLTCRANAGPPNMFVEALGMTPKACAIGELYSNLEKGEMDTALTDWHGVSSFKIPEVASKFWDEDLGTMTYFLIMNPDSYAALPADLQEVLDKAAADSIQYTDAWDVVQENIKSENADKLFKLADEERANLEAAAESVKDQWIEKTNGLGLDGQAIYDKAVELLEAHK